MTTPVQKLQSNSIYTIYSIKAVETTYGKTYILEDDDFNKYWATNKITDFINKNKIKVGPYNSKILFTIKTGEHKLFKKGDKECTYLEMNLFIN